VRKAVAWSAMIVGGVPAITLPQMLGMPAWVPVVSFAVLPLGGAAGFS